MQAIIVNNFNTRTGIIHNGSSCNKPYQVAILQIICKQYNRTDATNKAVIIGSDLNVFAKINKNLRMTNYSTCFGKKILNKVKK